MINQSKLLYREGGGGDNRSHSKAVATLHRGVPGDIEAALGTQTFTPPHPHIIIAVSSQGTPKAG